MSHLYTPGKRQKAFGWALLASTSGANIFSNKTGTSIRKLVFEKDEKAIYLHCVKSVRTQSYSGPHFPAFGQSIFSYSFRMRENTGKMRTRITPNMDTLRSALSTMFRPVTDWTNVFVI